MQRRGGDQRRQLIHEGKVHALNAVVPQLIVTVDAALGVDDPLHPEVIPARDVLLVPQRKVMKMIPLHQPDHAAIRDLRRRQMPVAGPPVMETEKLTSGDHKVTIDVLHLLGTILAPQPVRS